VAGCARPRPLARLRVSRLPPGLRFGFGRGLGREVYGCQRPTDVGHPGPGRTHSVRPGRTSVRGRR